MPVEHTLVQAYAEHVAAQERIIATQISKSLYTPKEATMPNSRYRYNVTIEIDALDGETGKTSSAATLEQFLKSTTVWQRAHERNVEVAVTRERIPPLRKRFTEDDLPGGQFFFYKKGGFKCSAIRAYPSVVVSGETGLHRLPIATVVDYFDRGVWQMAEASDPWTR